MDRPVVGKLGFFEALYPDGVGGHYLEIRCLPGAAQTFCTSIGEAVTVAEGERGRNTYFGVALRAEPRGDETSVAEIPALWVDVDWKGFEGGWKEAGEMLAAFEHGPSIVVETGNGWHCYWLLREPEEVTPENRLYLRGLLLGLAEALGGDRKCRDLSRVLRVPGTLNLKDLAHPNAYFGQSRHRFRFKVAGSSERSDAGCGRVGKWRL